MKKVLIAVFIIFTMVATVNAGRLTKDEISSQLIAFVNEINRSLPMRIDKDTRLDSTISFQDTLVFTYTLINLKANDVSQDMKNFLTNQAVNGYCTSMGDMEIFRNNNITLRINYRGMSGKFATTITINASNCN